MFAFTTHVGLTAASTSDADLMVMDDDADVVDTKCQRCCRYTMAALHCSDY